MKKGTKHKPESVAKMIGNKNARYSSGRYVRTKALREKISLTLKKKGFRPPARDMSGSNNPAWKGGIAPINARVRRSEEYRLWRTSVFERDHYTCIWCGSKSGSGKTIILHADHIKPFAHFPELRFAIDNGRTLCLPCHKTTETYAGKMKNYEQKC